MLMQFAEGRNTNTNNNNIIILCVINIFIKRREVLNNRNMKRSGFWYCSCLLEFADFQCKVVMVGYMSNLFISTIIK